VPTVAPTATVVPPTPTAVLPTATPVPTATAVPPTPTVTPTVAPVATATAVPDTGRFNLSVDFEGIDDEAVVYSDTVLLRGVTSVDAIVSVNDVILEVQPDGTFELTVILAEGPNVVDIVASNLDGSWINYSLSIISIPPDPSEEDSA